MPSPFDAGRVITELTLPHHLVETGTSPEAEAADEVERTEGSVTFRFGARRYLYDRLGLRINGPAVAGKKAQKEP